ncbi:MAG: hypothetical protein LH650_03855, partial [Chloroflexi bacterium]|nr:hypothetical protein [Chloroflexota bacterium]
MGWVQEVVVNNRTGYLVDGHLRAQLAISRDEATIPVVYVDLSEEEEALVLECRPVARQGRCDTRSPASGRLRSGRGPAP